MQQFTWKSAIVNKRFVTKLVIGLVLVAGILTSLPFFFQFIQKREGTQLNDFVLNYLPVADVSLILSICVWLPAILITFRLLKSPSMFIIFLWGYIFLTVMRLTTVYFVALNPPQGLIILPDPVLNKFYGDTFVTKDLFFSGHTSTTILISLCLQKKWDKLFAIMAGILVGILVLVQHIHYTIDVVFAAPFAMLAWYLSVKIAGNDIKQAINQ